ncbi:MAG: hypothetical protein ONB46_10415 [candidate division KSB1 bacterium]|nr:hypothetical protein [candidate division KSB1 bacterium]MDZ7366218.1 hypothetical protein [candidate division KSB1 bacterium]MDZ7404436.1 hypothetical protein [candidate division KSB1 bacterium]
MKEANSTKVQPDSISAIIELYKRDVDVTLIRENLKLPAEQRLRNLQNLQRFAEGLRKAGKKLRKPSTKN